MYCVALFPEQIDRFVTRLFDKGVSIAHPDNMHMPYSSDNPPPSVRVLASFNLFPICDLMNLLCS
jgi:hypothetical protein